MEKLNSGNMKIWEHMLLPCYEYHKQIKTVKSDLEQMIAILGLACGAGQLSSLKISVHGEERKKNKNRWR